MKKEILLTFVLGMSLVFSACKKNPVNRLSNPYPGGAVPLSSHTFTVFDDELKTGGGLGFFPGGENQSIDLTDSSSPRRSINQIRYQWNGNDVTNSSTTEHNFAGFTFSVTPDLSTLPTGTPRNLSNQGFTKVTLYVRGSVASDTTLRLEGPSDGSTTAVPARIESGTNFTLTSDWQKVEIPVPNASDFSNIKTFLNVSFQYHQPPRTSAQGGGGVVYLDDIRYE